MYLLGPTELLPLYIVLIPLKAKACRKAAGTFPLKSKAPRTTKTAKQKWNKNQCPWL